jgi:hypothetical protein
MTDDNAARNLLAIWQSELVAMAADRELREGWAALVTLWASGAAALLHDHPPAGSTGAAEPARATALGPAPDSRVDEIARLHQHIAELEQRLGDVERDRPG